MITIRPHHDLVTLKPAPELHAAIHNLHVEGGSIRSALFGDVRIDNPLVYAVTAKLNQFAMARVIRLGEGSPTGQGQDRPALEAGDVVGVDLGQVGNVLPGGIWQTAWRNLLCQFTRESELPVPLMNRVMVEYDDKLVDRFVSQRRDAVIHLARTAGAPIKTNNRAHTKVGLTVARVLAVGPGRFVKKVFEGIQVGAGEVVSFAPTNGVVDFTFKRGQLLKFVPWSEVESSIDGLEDE